LTQIAQSGRPRVVVAGGGLAGHRVAFALQHEAAVTLIDPKDFFEVPMAAPRMLVEPRRAADAIIPFADFLPRVKHLRDKVLAVDRDKVTTSAGDVAFDYLVLATGAAYSNDLVKPHEGTAPSRREHFHQWAGRIRSAKKIVIVGGGPVGVELAGELLTEHPGQQVTLIHSGPSLLPSLTPRPQKYALNFLQERGATVILNRQVTPADEANADLVLWCAGYRADTGYLRSFPGTVLDSSGRVLVDEHLRVEGTSNIFAIGDITALPEPKLGIWAGKHAAAVIASLRSLIRARDPEQVKLKKYKPATGSQMMLVTLGRHHGTGHLPFGDFTNSWFARTVKSRDMFIGRYRKGIGL